MSHTEKSSVQEQDVEPPANNSTFPRAEENYEPSSSSTRSQTDVESDEEYDELDEDEDEESMYSPSHTPTDHKPAFSESFSRFTSLPSHGASLSSSSSSLRPSQASSSTAHLTPAPRSNNILPPLRSLPIYTSDRLPEHIHSRQFRNESPSSHHQHHRVQQLSQRRSQSPGRRRSSVMRLEHILNTTSEDVAAQIQRPHSAGDSRIINPHWQTEHIHSQPAQASTAEGPSVRRPEFRIISGWGKAKSRSSTVSAYGDDDDDDGSVSVVSTGGLSAMDVDVDVSSTSAPRAGSASGSIVVHPGQGRIPQLRAPKVKRKAKMHPCPECHKEFPRPSGLKTHMTIHTKERPFSCAFPGCDRTFSVISNAKRHLRSHGITDPSNINALTLDANSPLIPKKIKDKGYSVNFDEPLVANPAPHAQSSEPSGSGMMLKWPVKEMELGDLEIRLYESPDDRMARPIAGNNRGTGKRVSGHARSRSGSRDAHNEAKKS